MIDYHVHPDFSHDARGSVADYCRRAVETGIEEICFTTHYEPDPERAGIEHVRVGGERRTVDSAWPWDYLAAIEESRRQFPSLIVRAGVEVGYEKGLEGKISDFLSRYQFDFVLCGTHFVNHIAITSGAELEEFKTRYLPLGAEWFAETFFGYVRAAVGSGLFDCIAHIDIYRKYIAPLFGGELEAACRSRLQRAVEQVAAAGIGLEVNTAGLRRGGGETYPPEWVVRAARDAGVRTFTIGSDAHRPEDLGAGVDDARVMLARLGLRPARFSGRRLVGSGVD
ncbi:MAG: histidinol-phosphatase HisJ family protein [candidate division WOR-3 bacterium]